MCLFTHTAGLTIRERHLQRGYVNFLKSQSGRKNKKKIGMKKRAEKGMERLFCTYLPPSGIWIAGALDFVRILIFPVA
eukprot:1136337-Pelagomonas_calceolata.AAC.2